MIGNDNHMANGCFWLRFPSCDVIARGSQSWRAARSRMWFSRRDSHVSGKTLPRDPGLESSLWRARARLGIPAGCDFDDRM